MKFTRTLTVLASAVVLIGGGAVSTAAANAAADRTGNARIQLDTNTVQRLKKQRIFVKAIAPGNYQDGSQYKIKMPVYEADLKGETVHWRGGFQFVKGNDTFRCVNGMVNINSMMFTCSIDSGPATAVFRIVSKPEIRVSGKLIKYNNITLAVNGKAMANLINDELFTNYFVDGMVIGTLNTVYSN